MEEIKRRIEELAEMVKERGGACIMFVDPDGDGKGVMLVNEGYERALAAMVGAAVISCEDMREYITKGVEAAQFVLEQRKQKYDKADC